METIKFELKYCERCGTLKLRPVASEATYCRCCERLLGRFACASGNGGDKLRGLPILQAMEQSAACCSGFARRAQ